MAVTSTRPSTRKAYYSNYGTEQADVSAPGGDCYDSPGNKYGNPPNRCWRRTRGPWPWRTGT